MQAYYDAGNPKSTGGDVITLSTTAGTLGRVTDQHNGTYTAILTSSGSEAAAVVSGTLNGKPLVNTVSVSFGVAKFTGLLISGLAFKQVFDPDITAYTTYVPNDEDSVKFWPMMDLGHGVTFTKVADGWPYTTTINEETMGTTLLEGANAFQFQTNGSAGEAARIYTVTVTRQESAKLTSLTASRGSLSFQPTVSTASMSPMFDGGNAIDFTPSAASRISVQMKLNGDSYQSVASGTGFTTNLLSGDNVLYIQVNKSGKT